MRVKDIPVLDPVKGKANLESLLGKDFFNAVNNSQELNREVTIRTDYGQIRVRVHYHPEHKDISLTIADSYHAGTSLRINLNWQNQPKNLTSIDDPNNLFGGLLEEVGNGYLAKLLGAPDINIFSERISQLQNYEKVADYLRNVSMDVSRHIDLANVNVYNGPLGRFVTRDYYDVAPLTTPLATLGVYTCAALVIVDRKGNKHYLAHVDPTTNVDQILRSLEEIQLSDSEIYVMQGTTPSGTVQNIFTALMGKKVEDRIRLVVFRGRGFQGITSYNGDLYLPNDLSYKGERMGRQIASSPNEASSPIRTDEPRMGILSAALEISAQIEEIRSSATPYHNVIKIWVAAGYDVDTSSFIAEMIDTLKKKYPDWIIHRADDFEASLKIGNKIVIEVYPEETRPLAETSSYFLRGTSYDGKIILINLIDDRYIGRINDRLLPDSLYGITIKFTSVPSKEDLSRFWADAVTKASSPITEDPSASSPAKHYASANKDAIASLLGAVPEWLPSIEDLLAIAQKEKTMIIIHPGEASKHIIKKIQDRFDEDISEAVIRLLEGGSITLHLKALAMGADISLEETNQLFNVPSETSKIIILNKEGMLYFFISYQFLLEEVFHVLEGDTILNIDIEDPSMIDAQELINDFLQLMLYPEDQIESFQGTHADWNTAARIFLIRRYRDQAQRDRNFTLSNIIKALKEDIEAGINVTISGQKTSIYNLIDGGRNLPLAEYLSMLLEHERFGYYKMPFGSNSSSPVSDKSVTDSSLIPQGNRNIGGIDFRSLPIVTQAIGNLSANISSSAIQNLVSINLDEEWQQIERLASSGITPSSERIKEYIQTSCAQDNITQDRDKILLCISDILRLEEERCDPTDATLRDILVVLESMGSTQELKQIFLGV